MSPPHQLSSIVLAIEQIIHGWLVQVSKDVGFVEHELVKELLQNVDGSLRISVTMVLLSEGAVFFVVCTKPKQK